MPNSTKERRYGKVKERTIWRDFNNLRNAIRSHDSEATEAAWDKCERWVGFVFEETADKD